MTKVARSSGAPGVEQGMDQRGRDNAAAQDQQGDGSMDSQATRLTEQLYKEAHPTRLYESQHPERIAAHKLVARALREGRLAKPLFCVRCLLPRRTEAHHADYRKPLAVSWLCRPCHTFVHPKTQLNASKKPTFQWEIQATHSDMAAAMRIARAS